MEFTKQNFRRPTWKHGPQLIETNVAHALSSKRTLEGDTKMGWVKGINLVNLISRETNLDGSAGVYM